MQQDLFQRLPNANVRVYAVWFNMYPGDARSKWPAKLLTEPRALHFWDEQRITGTRYMAQLPLMLAHRAPDTMQPEGDVMWDAFYVYAPGDGWQDPVPTPVSWGYPIMITRETLSQQIDALLAK